MSLCEIIAKAKQGNQESFLKILEQFQPTISKFSRELNYEGSESDLIITLLEFIRKPRKRNDVFLNEGSAVNYIYTILRNRRNDLFKDKIKYETKTLILPEIIDTTAIEHNMEDNYMIKDALNQLTERQKKIIIMRYIEGYSDNEISKEMCISRQAVCKARNAVIKLLRNILKVN